MCGFFSSDPLVSLLRSFGYNVVLLPKADISPLQILRRKDKEFHRYGELKTVFIPGPNIEIPEIKHDRAAKISGKKSGELKCKLGLCILEGILSAMGGSAIGLDAEYNKADAVYFQYDDVLEDRIEPAALDQYLTDADVSPFSTAVRDLLQSDDIYVITSTIKSKKFSVLPKMSSGGIYKPNIPAIQNIVSGKIEVSKSNKNESVVIFEGPNPLVFGFQATRLFYDKGRYTSQEPAKPDIPLKGRRARPISDSAFIDIVP